MSTIDLLLSRADPGDVEAIRRIVAVIEPGKGRLLKYRPRERKAAVAWTAFRAAYGQYSKRDAAFLMGASEEERAFWDRMTDLLMAVKNEVKNRAMSNVNTGS